MPKSLDPAAEAHWRHLVGGFPASGLSVREFCARHGVSPSGFYSRRRALAAAAASPDSSPPPGGPLFVPVRVADPAPRPAAGAAGGPDPSAAGGRIELLLEGGVTVRLCGEVPAERLAAVLAVPGHRGGGSC